MREVRDICIGEKYIDRTNQEKTAWHKIGTLFLSDEKDGTLKISDILKSCPIGSGSFAAFIPKPREEGYQQRAPQPRPYNSGAPVARQTAPKEDNSISRDPSSDEPEINIDDVPF